MNGEIIEQRLFDLVQSYNTMVLHIAGKVYYRGLRPIQTTLSAYKEDAVVAFLTGKNGDIQQGSCLVNVYVPDIQADSGLFYMDKIRCREIASALEYFPQYATLQDNDIYFKQSDMVQTLEEDSLHQHFVSLKMDFHVINENY
jgi:hypothetical protein